MSSLSHYMFAFSWISTTWNWLLNWKWDGLWEGLCSRQDAQSKEFWDMIYRMQFTHTKKIVIAKHKCPSTMPPRWTQLSGKQQLCNMIWTGPWQVSLSLSLGTNQLSAWQGAGSYQLSHTLASFPISLSKSEWEGFQDSYHHSQQKATSWYKG